MIFLCEVALGTVKNVNKAKDFLKPPEYCHSVKGVGELAPNPKGDIELEDGIIISTGEIIQNK